MDHVVSILLSEFVTHDVKRFIVSKPENFQFEPGQGVEIFINQPEWKEEEGRPFTPTSLTSDRVLEFTIKRYPEHKGVTDKLHTLEAGEELLMTDPFGTITYKGPGVFIAAGAGLTPFLSILRDVRRSGGSFDNHHLFYSNKTAADIICEKELRHYFSSRALFTLTREQAAGYLQGRIDKAFLERHVKTFDQHFYVCGPDAFVEDLNNVLAELGVSAELLVFEE